MISQKMHYYYIRTLVIILIIGIVCSGVLSDLESCEYIYSAVVDYRNDVVTQPDVNKMWPTKHKFMKMQLASIFVLRNEGSKEETDSVSKDWICQVADAATLSDLAAVVDENEVLVRQFLVNVFTVYESIKSNLRKYKKELRRLRKWVKTSQFPYEWPLSISFRKTSRFLNAISDVGAEYVLLNGGNDKNKTQVAEILTKSTSLSMYLEKMELSYLESDPARLNAVLMLSRRIKRRDTLMNLFIGLESYKDLLEAVYDIELYKLL